MALHAATPPERAVPLRSRIESGPSVPCEARVRTPRSALRALCPAAPQHAIGLHAFATWQRASPDPRQRLKLASSTYHRPVRAWDFTLRIRSTPASAMQTRCSVPPSQAHSDACAAHGRAQEGADSHHIATKWIVRRGCKLAALEAASPVQRARLQHVRGSSAECRSGTHVLVCERTPYSRLSGMRAPDTPYSARAGAQHGSRPTTGVWQPRTCCCSASRVWAATAAM